MRTLAESQVSTSLGISEMYECMCVRLTLLLAAEHISQGVTHDDTHDTNATWYECNVASCRAQYVVYHVDLLNVHPKCHYCRIGDVAPIIECTRCTSRVIWPEEYRTKDSDDFVCVGCNVGRQTVVEEETTANKLASENGRDWLLQNHNEQVKDVFSNRSLFYIASRCKAMAEFPDDVQILPGSKDQALQLSIRGKQIRNPHELIKQLYGWIFTMKAQKGQCSICFIDFPKDSLLRACGRSGCKQDVCRACLPSWYGTNAAGRIINTAALHCPFCRRDPTAKTLAKYGMGIRAVGNLKNAVDHSGEWIYAWCVDCGVAKQYMERVCARGAPTDIKNWSCEQCQEAKGNDELSKAKPCPHCGILTEKSGK